MRSGLRLAAAAVVVATGALVPAGASGAPVPTQKQAEQRLAKVRHFVVVFQENHSFDNLYGRWRGVDGLAQAPVSRTRQIDQAGRPYECLLQNDPNLASPTPLPPTCHNVSPAASLPVV